MFEHLYSFDIFFEKIKENENIFLSIPNFEYYIQDNNFNFLNIEHTFLYNINNIINIFKRNSYNIVSMEKFERHSIFFYFKKSYDSNLEIIREKNNINYVNFVKFYNNTINNIQLINNFIETNNQYEIIFFPCSMLLQTLISLGLEFKKVKYCFDNNKFKHNMRLYGTKLICLSLDDIKNISNHLVIIFNTCYSLEIEKQLIKEKIRYNIL